MSELTNLPTTARRLVAKAHTDWDVRHDTYGPCVVVVFRGGGLTVQAVWMDGAYYRTFARRDGELLLGDLRYRDLTAELSRPPAEWAWPVVPPALWLVDLPAGPAGFAWALASQCDWAVFPIERGGKRPLVKWREESTSNRDAVLELVEAFPDANWGIDCGKSGLVVVDCDSADAAVEWVRLRSATMPEGEDWTVRTGKGWHIYLTAGTHIDVGNSAGRLAKGIDVRGNGGYVLAPGSVHPSGATYDVVGVARGIPAVRELSDALAERMRSAPSDPTMTQDMRYVIAPDGPPPPGAPNQSHGNVAALLAWLAGAPVGERNNRLYWAFRQWLADPGFTSQGMFELAAVGEALGLTHLEVRATLASAETAHGRAQA